MKILLVTMEHPGHLVGGMGTFVREFATALRKHQGVSVHVLYLHYGNDEAPVPDTIVDSVIWPEPIFETGTIEGGVLERAASLRAKASGLLHSFQPDIIHCNDRQTYLPFRFEPNVIFSSHLLFADLIGTQGMNDLSLQDLKTERIAIMRSSLSIVYSKFMRTRVQACISSQASTIVLPLGFSPEQFSSKQTDGGLNIAYFGRFDGVQKGFFDFVRAIEELGRDWIARNKVAISLFGRGEFPRNISRDLFSRVEFLWGDNLRKAYGETHIVVMPSRYEPFGLVGLEAMASGCLLVAPQGQGIDEYATAGLTFVPTETDHRSLGRTINDVVSRWPELREMARRGQESVQHWTWERCASSHIEIYRSVGVDGGTRVKVANSQTYSRLEKVAPKNSLEHPETVELERLLGKLVSPTERTLVLHPFVEDPSVSFPKCSTQSIWRPFLRSGPCPKLEMIPCAPKSWDHVVVLGAWETQLSPTISLDELCRVARNAVTIVSWKGRRLPWQTLAMEGSDDWHKLLIACGLEGCWQMSLEFESPAPFWAIARLQHESDRR